MYLHGYQQKKAPIHEHSDMDQFTSITVNILLINILSVCVFIEAMRFDSCSEFPDIMYMYVECYLELNTCT